MERRYTKSIVELRQEEQSDVIVGSAIVYDEPYFVYDGFIEYVRPGALDGADLTDVLCTFNHEDECVLGRSINNKGNLKLMVNSKGLDYECTSTDTTTFNDCIKNIRAKIVNGNSFEFIVAKDEYEFDVLQPDGSTATIRNILKFKVIRAVNPVIKPAYLATEIDAVKRSVDEIIEKRNKTEQPKEVSENYYLAQKFKFNLN